ncbi:hypothetical protein L3Q82_005929 [Scortum barcoo]|uniref:Uncharacterized protein n=1 Tax=Scortum barcoo TaxID=214431 RepID=A0ACB8X341_9TELE|nr:hypothetical protein L3Q82_005929 [Scortum barcoo]
MSLSILTGVSCEDLTPVKKEEFSSEGSTVTLSYKYAKLSASDYFFWYRQYPGKPPQFLLSHSASGDIGINPVPGLKIKVEQNQISMNISSAAVTDSAALYYCAVSAVKISLQLRKKSSVQKAALLLCPTRYSKKATGSDYFFWYRQYPGKPPQFLISHIGTGTPTSNTISGLFFKNTLVFTDSELEQVRRSYFEQKRLGTEHNVTLSKELFCRLIRNTMTNMISITRATEDSRYPTKHEEHVAKKLMKRLSNVKSPRKAKVPPSKKPRLEIGNLMSPFHHNVPVMSSACSVDVMDSQKIQARHYKTLQEMYKSKKPNKAAVTHLLNLEFESRRRFITSDVLKEQDRATKILEAYPCFRELDHFIYGTTLYCAFSFKPVEHITAVFRALPVLFPSNTMPPKKLGSTSEALFHVLATSEDPDGFLLQRPLSSPVLLVSEDNCMIAIGNTPVTTFTMDRLK